MTIHPITDLSLPELAPYRTMRRQEEHRQQGWFIAEGEKVVRRLVESNFEILSVLLPPKWLPEFERLLAGRKEPVRLYVAEKSLLEALTGFSMYQGLLALGRVPPSLTFETWLGLGRSPRLLVAVDGLSSAENVGLLVRNCAAFGVQGLVVGETCGSPYLRRAVRASMGAIFRLPVLETTNLSGILGSLRQRGILCVAAHPHDPRIRLSQAGLQGDCCLVFGSEGSGISREVLAACAEAVSVPMQSGMDSLNVASAAAVFLYEVNRQRGGV